MIKREYLPALRGRLGDWAFYSVLMTLKQVADNVSYAKEIHKSEKLSELIQRELDDKKRAGDIGNYLRSNEDRFFNSLVVAVYDGDPEWHEFQNIKPLSDDINVAELTYASRYSIGYLSLSGAEKLFAIDGQHRLAGIRNALKEDADLGSEEVSVLIVAHHTDAAGQRRTRKLFTTLNKTAKPVLKSEIIALDEADAMAITARQLVENDPRFNDKHIHIKSKQSNLPQTDTEHLITLINLYDILEFIFAKFDKHTKAIDLKRLRPSDEALEDYLTLAKQYFTLLGKISPELKKCFASKTPQIEIQKHRREDGGHILFRPAGMLIFAAIVATLMRTSGMTLEQSVQELAALPTELSKPPYASILWDPPTGTMIIKNQALARDLLLYYLGFLKSPRTKKVLERYAMIMNDPSAKPPSRA